MIHLRCWEGYDSPRVFEPFERRSSTRVHARKLLSDADASGEILAVRAGACDVLNINNADVRGTRYPAGLVRPFDHESFELHRDRMLPE